MDVDGTTLSVPFSCVHCFSWRCIGGNLFSKIPQTSGIFANTTVGNNCQGFPRLPKPLSQKPRHQTLCRIDLNQVNCTTFCQAALHGTMIITYTPPKMNECSLKRDHVQKEISSSNHQFSAEMSVSSRVIGQNNPIFQPIIPGFQQISGWNFQPAFEHPTQVSMRLIGRRFAILRFLALGIWESLAGLVTEPWGGQSLLLPALRWKSPTRNCCWEWGCFKSRGPWHMVHSDLSFGSGKTSHHRTLHWWEWKVTMIRNISQRITTHFILSIPFPTFP